MITRRHALIAGLGVVSSGAVTAAGWAQGGAGNYPDHPIRVIVSVPAGGGVDTITRLVTAKMQTILGQPMVVENRAGVGGSIAAGYVFHSTPDGYTLLASQPSPITTNPLLYKSLDYDPTQLIPIVIMSHVPNVVLVRKDFPAKTVAELIAYAKANPGKINYASQGIGTTSHTTAELFQKITGTKMTHVPYKGTAPAVTDILAGNVDLMFNELASSIGPYQSGRARILAVTVAKRVPALPGIPTLEEAGVSGCDSDTWHALTAPPKTPDDIIAKLNAAANKGLADPDLLARFHQLSIAPGGGSPADAAAFIKSENARWSQVIKDAGIKPE